MKKKAYKIYKYMSRGILWCGLLYSLFIFIQLLTDKKYNLHYYQESNANVVDVEERLVGSSGGMRTPSSGVYRYTIKVEYKAEDKIVQAIPLDNTRDAPLRIGQNIDIYFYVKNPERCVISGSLFSAYKRSVGVTVTGVLLLLVFNEMFFYKNSRSKNLKKKGRG